MDSFAQELIDAIIDYLPRSHTRSHSLVAKRWRRRCQQRMFASVAFRRERDVVLWCTNIPQDPAGIPSYVQHIEFIAIGRLKSVLFGHVLKCFSKLKSLGMFETTIIDPEELDSPTPFGELCQQITRLTLGSTRLTTTVVSLILSLPNLQELSLSGVGVSGKVFAPMEGLQSGTLRLLGLRNITADVATTLARYPFTSRRISMGSLVDSLGVTHLLAPSSQTLVCLELEGVYFVVDFPVKEVMLTCFQDLLRSHLTGQHPTIHMPQLPALKTLVVKTYVNRLSRRLTDILLSIRSVPQLSSVTFTFAGSPSGNFPTYDAWCGVDNWLAQLARTGVRGEDSLKVEMRMLSEDWPGGEGFLCLFEKAGGEVRVVETLAVC